MNVTSKGKRWEMIHSLWMVFTWTGILSSFSFMFLGTKHRDGMRWGAAFGTIYMIPVIVYAALVLKFGLYGFHLLFIAANAAVSSYHALYIRKMLLVYEEYLDREKQSQHVLPPVDLNGCQISDLTRIPEFSARLAAKTIQVRNRIGQFRSIEHFGALLELPPRCLDKYRPYLNNKSVHEMGVPIVDA